jgi:hypothetical protein
MSKDFRVGALNDSSVLLIYSQKKSIELDPPYQREGGIWTPEKRQLLIDSIINGFDIPKLYFHEFSPMKVAGSRKYRYAIVDGRQRLETIWSFIDDEFPLPDDFEYLSDDDVKAGGLTYSGLAEEYPWLKIQFDSRTLPITLIRTNDIELIEEMFSRLNEAVPLNAAEKRNAWGGPIPTVVREMVKHPFFTDKVKVASKRYKHHDIATKFLLFERHNKVVDTKKIYLDNFVKAFKGKPLSEAKELQAKAATVMDAMAGKFSKNDSLLTSVGMLSLYYLLFRQALAERWYTRIQRTIFSKFEEELRRNRELAAKESDDVDLDLLEFSRLLQSPNDASSLRFRQDILYDYVRQHLPKK